MASGGFNWLIEEINKLSRCRTIIKRLRVTMANKISINQHVQNVVKQVFADTGMSYQIRPYVFYRI